MVHFNKWWLVGAGVYIALVKYLRMQRAKLLLETSASDCYKSNWLTNQVEFPWEGKMSMELNGLFRTYGIPSVSKLLVATGGFNTDMKRRYQDMEFLIREFTENDIENNDRAVVAVQRLNFIHANYKISNEQMKYVLTMFFLSTPRWVDEFGWRKCEQHEKEAGFQYWMKIGKAMGINDLWSSYEEASAWNIEYERQYLKYDPANEKVAVDTMGYFLAPFPAFARKYLLKVACGLLDPRLREALGLPKPYLGAITTFKFFFLLRGMFVKWLLPPRPIRWRKRFAATCPVVGGDGKLRYVPKMTNHGNMLYTDVGYVIDELGPKNMVPGKKSSSFAIKE